MGSARKRSVKQRIQRVFFPPRAHGPQPPCARPPLGAGHDSADACLAPPCPCTGRGPTLDAPLAASPRKQVRPSAWHQSLPRARPRQQNGHAHGAPLAGGTGGRETGKPGQDRKEEAKGGETTERT